MPTPLASLISQVLVAFTVEFDNAFELQMGHLGHTGARLSMIVWTDLMRFVPEKGVAIGDLLQQVREAPERTKMKLGCLERWGYVAFEPGPRGSRTISLAPHRRSGQERRAGWGSARGLRADWTVRLTPKGLSARKIWPPLFGKIEGRWKDRLGEEHWRRLRDSLQGLAESSEAEAPALPTLLSRLLSAFADEFHRESQVSLALCANVIRVLGQSKIDMGELPRLTGGSPEMVNIGWQLKRYVVVEPNLTRGRGKLVSLSPVGREAQQRYRHLVVEIEDRWKEKFGADKVCRLRDSLEELFFGRDGDPPPISLGMIPPEGVARAGAPTPSLGQRQMGAAARQRLRDLVAQTQAFLADPAAALPHYPLWDMNRGFGP